jgi:hypothetical protein
MQALLWYSERRSTLPGDLPHASGASFAGKQGAPLVTSLPTYIPLPFALQAIAPDSHFWSSNTDGFKSGTVSWLPTRR